MWNPKPFLKEDIIIALRLKEKRIYLADGDEFATIETNYQNFLSWSRHYELWEFRLLKISQIMGKEIYLL